MSGRHADLSASLARIFAKDGSVSGTGFLVHDNFLLTASDALRSVAPGTVLQVDFPTLSASKVPATIHLLPNSRNRLDQIASLRIEPKQLPRGAVSVKYDGAQDRAFPVNGFTAVGFKGGADQIQDESGKFGPRKKQAYVLLEPEVPGSLSDLGFLGAPVVDLTLGKVTGLVISDRPKAESVSMATATHFAQFLKPRETSDAPSTGETLLKHFTSSLLKAFADDMSRLDLIEWSRSHTDYCVPTRRHLDDLLSTLATYPDGSFVQGKIYGPLSKIRDAYDRHNTDARSQSQDHLLRSAAKHNHDIAINVRDLKKTVTKHQLLLSNSLDDEVLLAASTCLLNIGKNLPGFFPRLAVQQLRPTTQV